MGSFLFSFIFNAWRVSKIPDERQKKKKTEKKKQKKNNVNVCISAAKGKRKNDGLQHA